MRKRLSYGVDTASDNPWYRTGAFRVGLGLLAVVAVVMIVLFNRQIGDLLRFFGIRAALETGSAGLQGSNATAPDYFLADGYSASEYDPASGSWILSKNAVKVDDATDRLMIN